MGRRTDPGHLVWPKFEAMGRNADLGQPRWPSPSFSCAFWVRRCRKSREMAKQPDLGHPMRPKPRAMGGKTDLGRSVWPNAGGMRRRGRRVPSDGAAGGGAAKRSGSVECWAWRESLTCACLRRAERRGRRGARRWRGRGDGHRGGSRRVVSAGLGMVKEGAARRRRGAC